MVRTVTTLLLLLLLVSRTLADGFSSMPLRQVLLETDVIILVEISENEGTTTHRKTGMANFREAVDYTNDIKARVIGTHLGEFTSAEFNIKYSLTLVKGVWLGIPGSGLEGRMSPGEKYVFMLRHVDGVYKLQRAEKAEKLDEVLRLRKELDDEDRRVAEAQAKIPNGIYHYSDAATARKVRLQDGHRVQIGEQCDFDIAKKELCIRYNLILLCLTLGSGKPGKCVLIVDGKAYWLSDHHWAAGEKVRGAEEPSRLYCSFNERKNAEAVGACKDRKNAEAVGAYFGVTIMDAQTRTPTDPAKK